MSGGDNRSKEEDDVLIEHVTILLLGVTLVTAKVTSYKNLRILKPGQKSRRR
jgi:hypothetical protein